MVQADTHRSIATSLSEQPARAADHLLAALAYRFVSGARDERPPILDALATTGAKPQLAALLDDPDFSELRAFLDARGVAPGHLQGLLEAIIRRGELPTPTTPLEQLLGPLVRAAASGEDVDALERLRAQLQARRPDNDPAELDRLIARFRGELAAFNPSA